MPKGTTYLGGDFGCRHLPHVVQLLGMIRSQSGTVDRLRKGRHVKIYYRSQAGRKLMYTTALSPSDHRSNKNAVADVRRDLRRAA